MAAIIEWKDQQRLNQPFLFAYPTRLTNNNHTNHLHAPLETEIKGRLVFCDPITSFPKIKNESDINGSIVVIQRGSNSFVMKYLQAIQLGAILVIIANNSENTPNHGLFTCTGDLDTVVTANTNPNINTNTPCLLISTFAYRKLRLETPFMLSVSPLQSAHLSRLQTYDLGAALRSSVMFGYDQFVKLIVKEIVLREMTESRPLLRYQMLEDAEVIREATSLHIAVEYQQLSSMSLLIRMGANTECRKCDGYTPLHLATMKNDAESVALLVASSAYIDHPHPTGWTALHLACKYRAFDALQILLEGGADLNARALDGCTALHIACMLGIEQAVTTLVRSGADTTIESTDGLTASTVALYAGHPNCAAVMEKHLKAASIRRKSQMQKSMSSKAPIEEPQNDFADYFRSSMEPTAQSGIVRRSSKGAGLLDEALDYDDVFDFSGAEAAGLSQTTTENAQRQGLTRRPSGIAGFTSATDRQQYSLGSSWQSSLEKISDCMCERSANAEGNAPETLSSLLDSASRIQGSIQPGDHSKLVEMIESDLSRCCFLPYRTGQKRLLLKRLVLKVLYGDIASLDKPDESVRGGGLHDEISAVHIRRTWMAARASKGLSYRQGLLSLLAPIVNVWFGFELESDSGPGSSGSYVITTADDLQLDKCAETFLNMLYCFPSLSNYLMSNGTVEAFQDIFDAVMRILMFWFPNIGATLAWRSFSPALFSVPWVTTLMADVLSLNDVQYLWSRIFEISEDYFGSSEGLSDEFDALEMAFGDKLLVVLIAAAVLQMSDKIDPLHAAGPHTTNDVSSKKSPISKPSVMLPTQEDLLMLFSSVNNNSFHESIFEQRASEEQTEGLRNGSADSSIANFTRINVGEVAKCVDWLLMHTPRAIFKKSVSSSHVVEGTDNSKPKQQFVGLQGLWEVLGDLPRLTTEEILEICQAHHNMQKPLSILVIDVSGTLEAGSQFAIDNSMLALPNGASSGSDTSSGPRRRSSAHTVGSVSTELVELLEKLLQDNMKEIIADPSLMENLIAATIQSSSSKSLPLPTVSHKLLQELKLDGMIKYFRALAASLSQNHNRRVFPPHTIPSPPNSLRNHNPRFQHWRQCIDVSKLSSQHQELGGDSSGAEKEFVDSSGDVMIMLCAASSEVTIEYMRDVAATLVTCGFNRVAILKSDE